MFPVKEFIKRFEGILAELDALSEVCEGEAFTDLDDLNAELEDAIMLMGEIKPDEEDWQEEMTDALEELRALAGDYRGLEARVPELRELASQLEMAANMALGNL